MLQSEIYSVLFTDRAALIAEVKILQSENAALREENIALKLENQTLKAQVAELSTKLEALTKDFLRLSEQLKLKTQKEFGKSTEVGEKIIDNDVGLGTQTVAAYQRKKGAKKRGRVIDLKSLPKYTITHDLEEKNCESCKSLLISIGTDKSEQIEIIPKIIYLVEHIRHKYACRCCDTVVMAPKPQAPIPKALAGASLITEIIVDKQENHLPIYRQSKILANHGINIPDNTLGSWVMQAGEALMPLYDALWHEIAASQYLQVDETPVKLLQPERTAYIWAYLSPANDKKFVVYDFCLNRSGENPTKRLQNFQGKSQTDAYSGYNNLRNKNDVVVFGCNAHARRKFVDVLKITKNKKGIAAEAVKYLKVLYQVEEYARKNNFNAEQRYQLRQKKAKPVLEQYHAWLKAQISSVPANSKLAAAINYSLNQWELLVAYVEHGDVEIDNNLIENLIRPIALGRKNWLFVGNEESGTVNMLFFSLIQSCILQKINPRTYIHYILTQVHKLRRKEILAIDLLPHHIDKQILLKFYEQQAELRKLILNNLKFNTS